MISETTSALEDICDMGFIETHRSGDTGVGKTLEDLLDVAENNIPEPDIQSIELKTIRRDSNSSTTLFTKEPPERKYWNRKLINKLGYEDSKGRQALKVRVTDDPNNQGLYLDVESSAITVCHDDETIATYPFSTLRESFTKKLPNMLLVYAETDEIDGREHFWYNDAYFLTDFNPSVFASLVKSGVVETDLRMHISHSDRIRNRGTAWRVKDISDLSNAFDTRKKIL